MADLNRITGLTVGMYGVNKEITVVDDDGVLVDVSGYTGTKEFKFRSPNDLTTITLAGTFTTDGSDGKVYFTPSSGTTFDRAGDWEAQLQMSDSGIMEQTRIFVAEVDEQL